MVNSSSGKALGKAEGAHALCSATETDGRKTIFTDGVSSIPEFFMFRGTSVFDGTLPGGTMTKKKGGKKRRRKKKGGVCVSDDVFCGPTRRFVSRKNANRS